MIKYIIIGVAASVMLGLGCYMINSYGSAKYKAGESSCIASQAAIEAKGAVTNVQELERVNNETKRMSSDAILTDLSDLGILRNNEDR